MRRLFACMLALVMVLALAVPALAETEPEIDTGMLVPGEEGTPVFPVPEEPEDDGEPNEAALRQRLAEVTRQVKQVLAVDDDYTDYYSDFQDGILPKWQLNWSDGDRELSVSVAEDGTILNVYRWQNKGPDGGFYGFDPMFPAVTREEAEAQAEQWLAKLIPQGETARVDSVRAYLGPNGYYRFSGVVEKNRLDSPVRFALFVDGTGLSSFYRSDEAEPYVGQLPAPKPETAKKDAAAALAEVLDTALYYVSDGEGQARLRYVPGGPRTVVDALTGEAVDMDALYESFDSGARSGYGATMDAVAEEEAAVPAEGAALTEMELESIDKYADAMDQRTIDKALRELSALGLEGFELQRCSYSMDGETGRVRALLRYRGVMSEDQLYGFSADQFAQMSQYGDEMEIYKYIGVDAVTGALLSVSTGYPIWERDETVTMKDEVRQKAAENFLKLAAPDMAAEAALCDLPGYNEGDGLLYARTHAGYFFPENYLSVEINPATGTVDTFGYVWDEDVQFASAKDLVSREEALQAYIDALKVTLGYAAWPIGVEKDDAGPYARYAELGYSYVEELRLAYYYDGTEDVLGVDALTGQVLPAGKEENGGFVYTDLEDEENRDMILALAMAGIGFDGGAFEPAAALTQRDAAILLLQAAGVSVDPADEEQLESRAVWNGFVEKGGWDPDRELTRMEFLKMLLGPSRYGDAAALSGVWAESFDDVAEADRGCAAVAKALGMTEGDSFGPDETCTRAAGAEMLYRFMDR